LKKRKKTSSFFLSFFLFSFDHSNALTYSSLVFLCAGLTADDPPTHLPFSSYAVNECISAQSMCVCVAFYF
jgi:hypothetical protein